MTRRKQGNVIALADRKPLSSVYLAIEMDLRDLLRTIDLASAALVSDQDHNTKLLPTAFEYVEECAAALRKALVGTGEGA
jgi:hypothetical protein